MHNKKINLKSTEPKPTEQKPTDPNLTLEVNNDKLENLIVSYTGANTAENLNALVSHLHSCRVLVPANVTDKKQLVPCMIKNKNGGTFLPLYTSKKQIPNEPKSPAILNMPYEAVNKTAANPALKVDGIVINPFSNNLIFKNELVQKIDEVDRQRAQAKKQQQQQPQQKTIKMTPQQYAVFERKQFEFRFLPKKFFEEGAAFVDELCGKKEAYIDALYEESYQEKRMYPYLEEDFSVMAVQISEELQIIRVDMPERDFEDGACRRVFMVWDQSAETGRYFTIEKAGGGSVLAEVTSDWKHQNLGAAPAESAELQKILELAGNSVE
jgi:hypothetical protein